MGRSARRSVAATVDPVLTAFDDYPIHQTSQPVAHTASADLNHYDRYFFNGYDATGSVFFGVAMGLYPNRQVHDAAFSVIGVGPDQRQVSVFASALAPTERAHANEVGPITVEIVEPLKVIRVIVRAPEHGVSADLVFRVRTAPAEEPRFTLVLGTQTVFDYTRMTQWGAWEGWIEVDGVVRAIRSDEVLGTRDRSWGVRPVGERAAGAPSPLSAGFYWLWSPVNFPDVCIGFDVNEHADGRRWHAGGVVAPVGDGPVEAGPVEQAAGVDYEIAWRPGTRHPARFAVTLDRGPAADGSARKAVVARFEPILDFFMAGIGYGHPQWRHGSFHGREAGGREDIDLSTIEPLLPHRVHVQTLCQVTRDDGVVGTGVLETLVFGPHAPTGLTGLLDGAT